MHKLQMLQQKRLKSIKTTKVPQSESRRCIPKRVKSRKGKSVQIASTPIKKKKGPTVAAATAATTTPTTTTSKVVVPPRKRKEVPSFDSEEDVEQDVLDILTVQKRCKKGSLQHIPSDCNKKNSKDYQKGEYEFRGR